MAMCGQKRERRLVLSVAQGRHAWPGGPAVKTAREGTHMPTRPSTPAANRRRHGGTSTAFFFSATQHTWYLSFSVVSPFFFLCPPPHLSVCVSAPSSLRPVMRPHDLRYCLGMYGFSVYLNDTVVVDCADNLIYDGHRL